LLFSGSDCSSKSAPWSGFMPNLYSFFPHPPLFSFLRVASAHAICTSISICFPFYCKTFQMNAAFSHHLFPYVFATWFKSSCPPGRPFQEKILFTPAAAVVVVYVAGRQTAKAKSHIIISGWGSEREKRNARVRNKRLR
jgi:hypothetical protein